MVGGVVVQARWLFWLAWMAAIGGCRRDSDDRSTEDADTDADTDTDSDTAADTDTAEISPLPTGETGDFTTTAGPDWASCALAPDNALRVVCQLTDPGRAGTATWTVTQGTRVRTATSEGTDAVVLWGFGPNQQLSWQVDLEGETGGGAFPTDPLPDGVASLQASTAFGAPVTTEAYAVPYTCKGAAGAAVFDASGDVVWYQQESASGDGVLTGITGIDWVGDRVFLSIGGRAIAEYTVEGEEVFRIDGTERPVHHDNAWGSPHRFVLNAAQHGISVVDGFYVIDDRGAIVAEWDLADHVTVGDNGIGGFWILEFPFAEDWSHANSIEVDGPDHVLISLKHLNTVMRVVSNPDRPDFGDIEWTLDGGRGLMPSSYGWTDDGAFFDQHHVARRSDGGLTLFDNSSQPASRALALSLDEGAGTVSVADEWAFERRCAIQGSVYEQADGTVLSLCQVDGTLLEFPAGSHDPSWRVDVQCIQSSGGSGHLARAIPVDLPD